MLNFSRDVAASADDGYWNTGGTTLTTNTTYLILGDNTGTEYRAYLRFANVTIPQGVPIAAASVTFYSYSSSYNNSPVSIVIKAVDADSPAAPSVVADAVAWTYESETETWTISSSWSAGSTYTTVDISSIIQAIINRPGWSSGNSIILVFDGTGNSISYQRRPRAYDYGSSFASLSVDYNRAVLADTVSLGEAYKLTKSILVSETVSEDDHVFGGWDSSLEESTSLAESLLVDKHLLVPDEISLSETILINKRLLINDEIVASDSEVAIRGGWTRVRNHPHATKLHMAVKIPRIIWTGRVLNDRGYNESGDKETDLLINVTAGGNVSGFDVTNFLPDLTLWVGSTAGAKDHGVCRIKAFSGSNLKVSADMTCVWHAGDYLSITDVHDYWPRLHRTVATGSSVTVYKDNDIAVADRVTEPVPVFGPPVCAFIESTSVTVNFHGSQSYLIQPNSDELYWSTGNGISSYAWWFEGATVTTASGADVTATYATPGQYVARLTVTGENGETARGFRNVYIFNRTTHLPLEPFSVDNFSGSLSSHGWECQVEVFDELFSSTTLPQKAEIVLFAEETFAGVVPDFKLGNPAVHDRNNIKMVGYLADSTMRYGPNGEQWARVTIQGLQQLLSKKGNYPCYWTMIETYAPAWSKFWHGSPEYGLTVRKVWYHTIRWHWTLFNFTDVFIPDDHNNYLPGQNFSEGTLAQWLTEFTDDTQAEWVVDKGGALHIFSVGNYLPAPGYAPPTDPNPDGTPTGRDGAEWRTRLYTTIELGEDDFSQIEPQERIQHEVARVRVEGVMASDTGWYATSVDMAPGDIRGLTGSTETISNQVLGTGGFYGSQGYELALMKYAEESRTFERISLDLCGNYSFFDISPYANWFTVTLNTSLRNLLWDAKPFWVTEVRIKYDGETGDMTVSLSATPETKPDFTLGVYSQFEEVGQVEQIQGTDGNYTFSSLLADMEDKGDTIIPALLGNGGGAVEATESGMCYARLYGDANMTVLVENRDYANVDNRPVLIQCLVDAIGRRVLKVVGVRSDDDDEADADSAKTRTVRTAIFMNPGVVSTSTLVDEVYSRMTIFSVGPLMQKAYVRNVIAVATIGDGEDDHVYASVYAAGTNILDIGLSGVGEVTYMTDVSATLTVGQTISISVSEAVGAYDLYIGIECLVYGI